MTFLLNRIFKDRKAIKYIPSVMAATLTIAFFIKGRFYSQGWEGLIYGIFMVISGAVFIVSIVTAAVIDFIRKRRT